MNLQIIIYYIEHAEFYLIIVIIVINQITVAF